jgi:hypothetical protein
MAARNMKLPDDNKNEAESNLNANEIQTQFESNLSEGAVVNSISSK